MNRFLILSTLLFISTTALGNYDADHPFYQGESQKNEYDSDHPFYQKEAQKGSYDTEHPFYRDEPKKSDYDSDHPFYEGELGYIQPELGVIDIMFGYMPVPIVKDENGNDFKYKDQFKPGKTNPTGGPSIFMLGLHYSILHFDWFNFSLLGRAGLSVDGGRRIPSVVNSNNNSNNVDTGNDLTINLIPIQLGGSATLHLPNRLFALGVRGGIQYNIFNEKKGEKANSVIVGNLSFFVEGNLRIGLGWLEPATIDIQKSLTGVKQIYLNFTVIYLKNWTGDQYKFDSSDTTLSKSALSRLALLIGVSFEI